MRILIATVTAGAGHLQAASALRSAWRMRRPKDRVELVDLLELVPAIHRNLYVQGYLKLLRHAPELWGRVFRKTDDPGLLRKLRKPRQAFMRQAHSRFIKHLDDFDPEVVICTHYLPVEILGGLARRGERCFTACVITDFDAHAVWMHPVVDLYCVACEHTKSGLEARGIRPEAVIVTGIPVGPSFGERPDKRRARKALALRDDLPVLLVLGGGLGMGPVREILAALDRMESPLQVLVVTGRNEELRGQLACDDHRHPARVLGYVENMPELMAAADLVITKPGGLTTSEALALGKPLLILHPIPGQEEANSDFLLEQGAAVKAVRVADVPHRLRNLIGTARLAQMGRAARRLGRPSAAAAVCEAILGRLGRQQRHGAASAHQVAARL